MSGTSVSYGNMRPSLSHRKVTVLRALRRWDATLPPCHPATLILSKGAKVGGRPPNCRHGNNPSLGPVRRVATRFVSSRPQPASFLPGVKVKGLETTACSCPVCDLATFTPASAAAERCALGVTLQNFRSIPRADLSYIACICRNGPTRDSSGQQIASSFDHPRRHQPAYALSRSAMMIFCIFIMACMARSAFLRSGSLR